MADAQVPGASAGKNKGGGGGKRKNKKKKGKGGGTSPRQEVKPQQTHQSVESKSSEEIVSDIPEAELNPKRVTSSDSQPDVLKVNAPDLSTKKIDSTLSEQKLTVLATKKTSIETELGATSTQKTEKQISDNPDHSASGINMLQEKKDSQAKSGDGKSAAQGSAAEAAPQKSKAELRAERRAKQEAQRAAKAAGKKQDNNTNKKAEGGAKKGGGDQGGKKHEGLGKKSSDSSVNKKQDLGKESKRVPDHMVVDDIKTQKRINKRLGKQQIPERTVALKKVGLFSHLHQYEREVSLTQGIGFGGSIHPAILKLGLQYAEGVICGSNARCIALLASLKQVIKDYSTPHQKDMARDLDAKLKPNISFLTQCRHNSVSMGSAIKHLKHHINQIPSDMTDAEAKEKLCQCIDDYVNEQIILAGKSISQSAGTKINDGDVILVYGCSSLIRKVLCDAHDSGKKFKVIVADGRPKLEGQEMLRRLVKHGIVCSYVLINAVSYTIREVTKVFLGAHALLANGYVMSRVGSSQIALVAKSYNVPVLVCCETYKFSERVQTDSFVFNELGDPDDLVQIQKDTAPLSDWRSIKSLSLLNLVYDVTPPEMITMVITEFGMIPCTSVPVVIRVKHTETNEV